MGEKKKFVVFKLNWIPKRDLEFEVHEKHTEKEKKQVVVDMSMVEVDS